MVVPPVSSLISTVASPIGAPVRAVSVPPAKSIPVTSAWLVVSVISTSLRASRVVSLILSRNGPHVIIRVIWISRVATIVISLVAPVSLITTMTVTLGLVTTIAWLAPLTQWDIVPETFGSILEGVFR